MNKLSPQTRSPALILLLAGVFEVLVMLHHPEVRTPDIATAIVEIARQSTMSALVHGVLIVLMLCACLGFIDFCVRRGLDRSWIRAGALGYGCGVLVMIGAAMVSGFIVTGVASIMPHSTAADLQITQQILLLCRVLNQSCATVGAVAMSAGIVMWSVDLARTPGPCRFVGALGGLTGLATALALVTGLIRLDVHGMRTVVLVQAIWSVSVAMLMLRHHADTESGTLRAAEDTA